MQAERMAMTQQYTSELALFINGSWRSGEGRETLVVRNPASGAGIADLPVATPADLEEALAAAEQGFRAWRAVDVDTRAAILRKAAALLRERAEMIAVLLTTEQGKPKPEALGEIIGAASFFDFYAEEARRAYGRVLVRPTGQRALVIKQPVGPVAVFTPWNFPVYMLAKKLGHSGTPHLAGDPQGQLHRIDRSRQAPDAAGGGRGEADHHGTWRPCAGAGVR